MTLVVSIPYPGAWHEDDNWLRHVAMADWAGQTVCSPSLLATIVILMSWTDIGSIVDTGLFLVQLPDSAQGRSRTVLYDLPECRLVLYTRDWD